MESKIHHSSPDDLVEVSGVMRQSYSLLKVSLSLLRTSALMVFFVFLSSLFRDRLCHCALPVS